MTKKLIINFSILFCIIFNGCAKNKNPCNLPEQTMKDLASIDSLISVPEFRNRLKIIQKGWFQESSLFDETKETYRLIWHSSFGPYDIFRIQKDGDIYRATIKKLSQNDSIPKNKEFLIPKKKWEKIANSFLTEGFWYYPSSVETKQYLDGCSWLLEGYKPIKDKCTNANYHFVSRSNDIEDKFKVFCNLLETIDSE